MSMIMVRIPGINGGSEVADRNGYHGCIACISMRHAVDLPIIGGTARSAGTARQGPIELMHIVDAATPALKSAAATGLPLGDVTICRVGMFSGQMRDVETIYLSNAYVVRVDADTLIDPSTNEPSDELFETFALEYSDIRWDHPIYVDGQFRGSVSGTSERPPQAAGAST